MMYNYKSDVSRNDPFYEVEVASPTNNNTWINYITSWSRGSRWVSVINSLINTT